MSEKLQFPTTTLMCIDCVNSNRAIAVLEHCKSLCDFADVKFLSSIPSNYEHHIKIKPLNSLTAYSVFMVTKCIDYIDTERVLICQRDGFIINPDCSCPRNTTLTHSAGDNSSMRSHPATCGKNSSRNDHPFEIFRRCFDAHKN